MNILIVGLGSIGSEIAYTFYSSSHITCIDHGKHFESIKKILPKINYVKGDIHDPSLIENLSSPPVSLIIFTIFSNPIPSIFNSEEDCIFFSIFRIFKIIAIFIELQP